MEVTLFQIFLQIIVCAIVVYVITESMKKSRARRVWIIEDSETDRALLKINIDATDIAVTYIKSAKEFRYMILRPWLYKRPDQVLADYHLEGEIKGTQITALCENNDIPCLLMTGDDRDILGISADKVVRKSTEQSFYDTISSWIHTQKVHHG